MTVIGITGPSGAGKTTALLVLEELGALVIDCDAVYHRLLKTSDAMLGEIGDRFPEAFPGGVFDRKRLGRTVFQDPQALLDLNRITHAYVAAEVDGEIAAHRRAGGDLVAVDAIALLESGLGARCTAVVGVIAPARERARRLVEREGITMDYALTRIRSQKPDSFFRENCQYILENNFATDTEFKHRCRELFLDIIAGKKEENQDGHS